ncbi:MAG: extracellular solute-binding protein [Nocardioidaceae bacterium]
MTRTKTWLCSLGAVVFAASLTAGCGGSDSDAKSGGSGTLTFVGYGGETQDLQANVFEKPFTKETGIEFRNDSPPDTAKLKAMTQSGKVSWDVVTVTSAGAFQLCGTALEKVDTSIVDFSVLGKNADRLKADCGTPAYFSSMLFAYDSEKFANDPPTSIEDFFDTTKYPGKRVFPPELEPGFLEFALMADGVAPEDLYPLDVDRALKKLDTIKDDSIFADSYGAVQQDLASQTAAMALTPPTRLYYVLQDGAPYKVVWDKTMVNWDYFAIPKGSENAENANKFLAFSLEVPQQTAMTEAAGPGIAPVNPNTNPEYNDLQETTNPFAPDHVDGVVYVDPKWWGDNVEETYEKFTKWQVG